MGGSGEEESNAAEEKKGGVLRIWICRRKPRQMLYLSFFLICHPLSPIICIYDPAVFESVLFQQMLHDLIIPVGIDLQVAALR